MKKNNRLVLLIIGIFIVMPVTVLISLFFMEKRSIEFDINGAEKLEIELGNEYIEEGFTAITRKKDLSKFVEIEGIVDTTKVDDYTISYVLKVPFLSVYKKINRTISVREYTPPTIKVHSEKKIITIIDNEFAYPTYEATDDYDGDITDKVTFETDLDTSKEGTYTVKFIVADSSGNEASEEIEVQVVSKKEGYIDIDIANQKLTYYENGNVRLTSDIVTGKIGKDTPTGTYKILNKLRNIDLVGYDYRVPVQYWMAFIGSNYGIHDAYWRNGLFGGDYYKTDGSRGCVNMPLDKISELYNLVEKGTPVYIHD